MDEWNFDETVEGLRREWRRACFEALVVGMALGVGAMTAGFATALVWWKL